MHKCSVGFILYLKCGAGKKDIFMKIDIDELLICRVELLQTRLKIRTLADVFDLCPNHKLQFTENYSHEHHYKCVDPFSMHKQMIKMNSHEVRLPEFHSMFSFYNVLLRQKVCMNCFKRAKDNVVVAKLRWMRKRRKMKSQLKLHAIQSISLYER